MDVDWCLTCNRHTNDGQQAYCSPACQRHDQPQLSRTRAPQSLPIDRRRRSFEMPPVPQAKSHTTRGAHTGLSGSGGFPLGHFPSKARFHDEELQVGPSTLVTGRWTGKDRHGIMVWAHAVSPGLEDDGSASTVETDSEVAVLASFRFTRPPPFPLTAQNLAPPCVTIVPRHVLLNHTSLHSHQDEPSSLSQDDASLLTPATESVITPSAPDTTPPPASKVGRLVQKVYTWMTAPRTFPEEGHSTESSSCSFVDPAPSIGAGTDATRSSAIKVGNASTCSRPSGKRPPSAYL